MELLNPNVPISLVPARELKGVVFDWAGTTVDFGSLAPVRAFEEVFATADISVTEHEVRQDMGVAKRDHIRKILLSDRIAAEWNSRHGSRPGETEVDELYGRFVSLQLASLERYSDVIDGVPEVFARCHTRGLRIGTTTGYTRQMLDILIAKAARSGYTPECNLTPEDVAAGRPHPFMLLAIARRLELALPAIAKIGDTPADIAEGLNAGAWSIGVAKTGNMVGLSCEAYNSLTPTEKEARLQRARLRLAQAGAHYVVDSVADLEPVLDDIDTRLRSRCL